jgi:apolipoprotein N-acyltransferase
LIKAAAGALASAILLALFARLDPRLVHLGWVSLVPFMVTQARLTRVRHVLGQAWLLTMLFAISVFGWFSTAMADYTHSPHALGWVALTLAAPLLQPQIIVFAVTRFYTRSLTTAICAWLTCEWLYPKMLGDTLGYALYPAAEFRQCADIAGVAVLTAALLAVNAAISLHTRRSFALTVTVLVSLYVYGAARLHQDVAGELLRIGLVQTNLTDYEALARKGTYAATQTILDVHEQLSREAIDAGAELIVWPETVYPTTFGTPKSDSGRDFDARIRAFPKPLVFGTYDTDGVHEYNAAVVLPGGETYRKRTLFPLTERTWGTGDISVITDTGIAPLICYDVVDAHLAHDLARDGARLLVTLSNDRWFQYGDGPELHLVVAAFRSVETHLPQARATTSGISALIDAHGQIRSRSRENTRETLVGDVVVPPRGHPAGTWAPGVAVAVLIIWPITSALRRRLLP